MSGGSRVGRRAVGVLLVALLAWPWYRLAGVRATSPGAEQTLRLGDQYFAAHWIGLALAALAVVVLSRLLPRGLASRMGRTGERWLVTPPVGRVALALGALASGVALAYAAWGLGLGPALPDGAAQLVQARYFSAGALAGPVLEDPAFWHFPFMVATAEAWTAQYPPGFAVALALGWTVGAPWLVGPLLSGAAVALTALVADRLLPGEGATARLGAALAAVSLFLAFHAASYMNHVLAAALVPLALLASLRAMDGSWRWALLSGAAAGALFATRPWVGVVLGPLATVGPWATLPGRARLGTRGRLGRAIAVATGAAPFVAGVLAYNARLFGSPVRFGYVAAAGPAHGLGFHADPWGSPYGLIEAIGATSADLLGLSLDLVQAPLPVVVLVAGYLVLARKLARGAALIAAWALLPVAANALYWHHDLYMGPRLLYEAAPAWCLLVAGAALALCRYLSGDRVPPRLARACTASGVAATFALALGVGLAVSGPLKLAGLARAATSSGMTADAPTVERPSLVFVHEDWESRLGARLAALGVRLDSIRVALRNNSTCEVERFVGAWEAAGRAAAGSLDFGGAGGVGSLRPLTMPSGAVMRTYEGEVLDPACEREAASDYAGVVALPPLLWQGDLPGLDTGRAMFVRDLGPERNDRLRARFPDREPLVLLRRGAQRASLVEYGAGMRALWSAPTSDQEPAGPMRP